MCPAAAYKETPVLFKVGYHRVTEKPSGAVKVNVFVIDVVE